MRMRLNCLHFITAALTVVSLGACQAESEELSGETESKLKLPGSAHPGGAGIGLGWDSSSESFRSVPCIFSDLATQSRLDGKKEANLRVIHDKSVEALRQSMNVTARVSAQ